jgi:hypothetical protein
VLGAGWITESRALTRNNDFSHKRHYSRWPSWMPLLIATYGGARAHTSRLQFSEPNSRMHRRNEVGKDVEPVGARAACHRPQSCQSRL